MPLEYADALRLVGVDYPPPTEGPTTKSGKGTYLSRSFKTSVHFTRARLSAPVNEPRTTAAGHSGATVYNPRLAHNGRAANGRADGFAADGRRAADRRTDRFAADGRADRNHDLYRLAANGRAAGRGTRRARAGDAGDQHHAQQHDQYRLLHKQTLLSKGSSSGTCRKDLDANPIFAQPSFPHAHTYFYPQ